MLTIDEVRIMIQEYIKCEHLHVEGDGHHFFIWLVSDEFIGKSRLERHRLVKEKLKEKIELNELHALSIQSASTPEEWSNNNT